VNNAGAVAHCAAIVTFAVVMAARPVSADPRSTERSRFDCGTHRVGYPNGSFDPLRTRGAALRSAKNHRAVVGIPQTAPGGLAHPVVKRFIAQHDEALARCYPRRLPATTGAGQIGLSIVILPSGRVQLLGALGFDAEVTSCMAKIVESINFPRSPGGEVTHTFVPITIVPVKR
jgi:hypothetical protein